MKLPPIKSAGDETSMDVTFSFGGRDCGDGSIGVCSDGAGAFIEIKAPADGIRLNPEHMFALGKWAVDACRELDEFNGEAEKQKGGAK